MNDRAKDAIKILEEAEETEGKGADLYISSFFWAVMRWDLLNKDTDVNQVTDAEEFKTGDIVNWRGHKLFIKRDK